MSADLFMRYQPVDSVRDTPVAAVKVEGHIIRKLAPFVGGTAITKTIRGGTQVYCEILLHGQRAKVGDYIIAGGYGTFQAFPGSFFETKYKLVGPLPLDSLSSSVRR